MSLNEEVAKNFFEACEAGKGSEKCSEWCTPDATFSAQAEPLADVKTLADYTNWMKGLMTIIPDGFYDLKNWGLDEESNSVIVYAVFKGTHTGEGGPISPTNKKVSADYVYVIQFDEDTDKIIHMTKIWNAPWSMRQLGWIS